MGEEFSRVETSRVVIDGISSPELGANARIGSIFELWDWWVFKPRSELRPFPLYHGAHFHSNPHTLF